MKSVIWYILLICVGLLPFVAAGQDIVMYDSLDEAIESEIEGIDFSDMDGVGEYTIRGWSSVSAEKMAEFVKRHNPQFDKSIADAYIEVSKVYGIRGDIAFCQAILETGWFKFDRGTVVSPENHNYCGLGVVKRGVKGEEFETVKDGVTAHLQHLYAYCCNAPIPDGEKMLDPRFKAVKRGVANEWSDLNNRWAMNPVYGSKILKIYDDLLKFGSR